MAKVFTYVVLFAGIDLLFLLAGFETAGSGLLNALGLERNILNVAGLTGGVIVAAMLAAFASLAMKGTSSTAIGTITSTVSTAAITAAYSAPLLAVIYDIVKIIGYKGGGGEIAGILIALILLPLAIGYTVAIWSWVQGND